LFCCGGKSCTLIVLRIKQINRFYMCKDTAKTWIVQEKTLFIESRMSDKSKLEVRKGAAGISVATAL